MPESVKDLVHVYRGVSYIAMPGEILDIIFKIEEEKRQKRVREILARKRICSCLRVPHCQFKQNEIEALLRGGQLRVLFRGVLKPPLFVRWGALRGLLDITYWLEKQRAIFLKRYRPDHVGSSTIEENRRIVGESIILYRYTAS